MNQRGSINLPVVIAAAFGIGLAASMYLNYNQSQTAEQDRKLMQGQITDLRYQVKQDGLATAGSSPSPTPLATPEPSPTASPVVAGTASIDISQMGVKLTVADPIVDLIYDWVSSGSYKVATLSTRTLVSKYAACKPTAVNNVLGFIVQKKASVAPNAQNALIKQIGIYKYYYIAPSGFCTTDQSGKDALAAARAALKNAALPTLTN